MRIIAVIVGIAASMMLSAPAFAFGSVPAKYVQPTPPTAAMLAHECQGPDGLFSVLTRGTCPTNGATAENPPCTQNCDCGPRP